ncbi:MAG: PEP-CTERM sorting domain-containing protein [Rhodoferax sp.]|nr:PEP-CTERM sorting domain-containing protein [Rhodoferax sp.]
MAPDFDFGTIDTVLGLSPLVAPTGNNTQFYFNSNDGGLMLAREDGRSFNLDGFSAAFVPQIGVAQNIVIVAYGWFADASQGGMYFGLGDTTTGAPHPFGLFNDPVDFSNFTDLLQLEFFACVLDTNVCGTASRNNAQFAIDDIRLSTVPEPTTLALLALGLLGLGWRDRRHTI